MDTLGPAPKPRAIRQIEGNPGKKKMLKDTAEPIGRPIRPEYVKNYAPIITSRLVRSMPKGVYKATDSERILWGTDWPHTNIDGYMPSDGDLVDLFGLYVPDEPLRKKMLVDNLSRLYGF